MPPFDRFLAIMTKPWFMLSYVGLIAFSFLYLDRPIAEYFYHLDLRLHFPLINSITRLGLGIVYLPALALLTLIFRYIVKNQEWAARTMFLFICVAIPGVICGFLKVLFGRARPNLWLHYDVYGFFGLQLHVPFWSFPSGHTTTIMSLAFGLIILFPRYTYAFLIAGITVALSRVLLNHHYLSDVLAASYLSLLEIGILLCFLRRKSWLAPAWGHAV
ncbi:phosphatase PAP2 family protein [Legionella jordanis]|uniref:undecaprenyl-diphosphate phosphatase n=1 Tax=Legionella jordanis TaxID=456 RepID=A0A0W0V8H4_9GAMM|nr:phosphatase PAP2 family protein [Legionella jordanis]KTD16435.1 phosphatidylglycerophosphatase B [Legionella jordanis]RMX04364.1 phosphatase PAP2 family protein [Legionella jordanis]RMX15554.1 phosphatase PAP2 family protein [Legionella jordanis]VEH12105.1 phosphatidylglycerophosphatase B [Legionella jordanis]HAT8714998.1 phosphatase PAP2 family protein [Legionella jordanis]